MQKEAGILNTSRSCRLHSLFPIQPGYNGFHVPPSKIESLASETRLRILVGRFADRILGGVYVEI
jgi:hypothetical protein